MNASPERTIVLTRGVNTDERTAWAEKHAEANDMCLLSRVDLRDALFGGHTRREQEAVLVAAIRAAAIAAINHGMGVVVDDTNLRSKQVKKWVQLAHALGASVLVRDFTDEPVRGRWTDVADLRTAA